MGTEIQLKEWPFIVCELWPLKSGSLWLQSLES